MFLQSGSRYYSVPLINILLPCTSGQVIPNPTINFRLLTLSDISKIDLMVGSNMSEQDIYEEVCETCILGILHFPNESIDYHKAPAGIVDHIGQKILHHSRELYEDPPKSYEALRGLINIYDGMQVIISHYTNTPIKEVMDYPIDVLYRQYAAIQSVIPGVEHILPQEEEISKVG